MKQDGLCAETCLQMRLGQGAAQIHHLLAQEVL
jgi:hypothetical protein